MGTYLRFRFGPFVAYQRLGRTQAQKKAAAKARSRRAMAKVTYTIPYTITAIEPDGTLVLHSGMGYTRRVNIAEVCSVPFGLTPGQRIDLVMRDSKITGITMAVIYTLDAVEPDGRTLVLRRNSPFGGGEYTERIVAPRDTPAIQLGQRVEVLKRTYGRSVPEIVSIRPITQ